MELGYDWRLDWCIGFRCWSQEPKALRTTFRTQQATSKLEDSNANEPLIFLLIDSIIQMATTKTAKGKAAAAKCAFPKLPENHPPAKILT